MASRPDRAGGAVLVLGASRGLGRAIAVAAAEAGLVTVLGCRQLAAGEAVAAGLRARGLTASAVAVDVTDYGAVAAAVAYAATLGDGLVGVVNNAGVIAPLAPIEATAPDAWSEAASVNLVGAYHGTRAALPRLADGGVIVNLSSGAADLPLAGWSAYCAAKAGLAMLTRCTHAEHGGRLRIYGARPGMVDTDMQAEIRASGLGPVSRIARGRLGDPAGAARAVAWLLRAAPEDLSGTEIELDSAELALRMGPPPGATA